MILNALLIIFGLNFGNTAITDAASGGPFARSASLFFTILTNYLQSAGYWTLLIGVLLLVGGWLFSGPTLHRQPGRPPRSPTDINAAPTKPAVPSQQLLG